MSNNNIFIINTLQFNQNNRIIGAEPRRENRFIVDFPFDFNIPSYAVQTITKPTLTFANNEYCWENIEIELIDAIGPSATQGLMNMIEYCQNYDIARVENQPLFSFFLSDLDPTGVNIGTWIVDVKELVLVNFGKNNYLSDELQKCRVILKPYRCRCRF
jgi:hypothetical protein